MTHKQRDKPSEAFQDNFARLQFYSLVEEYRAAEKHLSAKIARNAISFISVTTTPAACKCQSISPTV